MKKSMLIVVALVAMIAAPAMAQCYRRPARLVPVCGPAYGPPAHYMQAPRSGGFNLNLSIGGGPSYGPAPMAYPSGCGRRSAMIVAAPQEQVVIMQAPPQVVMVQASPPVMMQQAAPGQVIWQKGMATGTTKDFKWTDPRTGVVMEIDVDHRTGIIEDIEPD